MKKILMAATSALLFLSLGASVASAQDEQESEGLSFVPVDAYGCNFNEGKGPADLDAVIEEWNAWMDDNGQTQYTAFTLWPNYYGESPFDVGWLGVYPDGNAMGAGADNFRENGQAMGARFAEVLDCGSHTNFATVRVKAPPENDDEDDTSFVLQFSNCSVAEGKTFEDFMAGQKEWNAYADEHGIVGGSWVMFPVWGETADADYGFKLVHSTDDYSQLGANWAKFAEGHYQKNNELFDDLLDCDSPRVYSAEVARMAEEVDD